MTRQPSPAALVRSREPARTSDDMTASRPADGGESLVCQPVAAPAPRRFRRWLARSVSVCALLPLLCLLPSSALADDIIHVVGKGSTLDGIARRYHTTVAAILAKNDIGDGHDIRPGQKLHIEVDPKHLSARERAKLKTAQGRAKSAAAPAKPRTPSKKQGSKQSGRKAVPAATKVTAPKGQAKAGSAPATAADPYAKTPARAGYVTMIRGDESFRGTLVSARGKLSKKAQPRVNHLLRDYRKGDTTPIAERLLSLLADVSDHFGSRTIMVVSGFRARTPTQFTKNSKHNHGSAIDFRIAGIPNEVLRDYCLTFPKVGVGYYPRSSFVHLDVRDVKVNWTDYSGPGEAPRYARNSFGRRSKSVSPPSNGEDEREPDDQKGSPSTPKARSK